MGKAAIAGISLILVVGVVIGTVTFVNRGGNSPAPETPQTDNAASITGGMKAAESLCAPADFKDDCMDTLRPVAQKDNKASPMQLVAAAFEAALAQVKKALDKSTSLHSEASDEYDKLSLDSCKVLMDCAIYELEEAIVKVKNKETDTMDELLDDLNTWLSSVIADSQSCLDDIHKPELKGKMQAVLDKTDKLTVNALAIVDE
ncbi:pectinesterase inhibitor domain-containing protein, partial [Ralstonia pseudosolanacearum]|uniref:pectinesterase inhibitor domain-containing protein n=1 Tax=Ralstonia pseudosolanacearum TaxID=1310165 RepID=UPI003CF247E9